MRAAILVKTTHACEPFFAEKSNASIIPLTRRKDPLFCVDYLAATPYFRMHPIC